MLKKFISKQVRVLSWHEIFVILRDTFVRFFREKAFYHAASLSYFSIVALVPILYLSIASFGQIIGQEKMLDAIRYILNEQVGIEDTAGLISFLDSFDFEKGNSLMKTVGIISLIISSTALFASMKHSINDMYDVHLLPKKGRKLWIYILMERVSNFLFLTIFGLLLVLTYFGELVFVSLGNDFFGEIETISWLFESFIQQGIVILSNLILFFFVYKFIHNAFIPWKLALAGSVITTVFFYIGHLAIKYYVTHFFFAKNAGIAGTILILLVFVYYTSQLIFLGAKLIAVYAEKVGFKIQEKQRSGFVHLKKRPTSLSDNSSVQTEHEI
jgi:membrane protein